MAAGADAGFGRQRIPRSEPGHRQAGRLLERQPVGDRRHRAARQNPLLAQHTLRGPAERAEPHLRFKLPVAPVRDHMAADAVARREIGNIRGDFDDRAGCVAARDQRQRQLRLIDAAHHQQIAVVQRRRGDGDAHHAGAERLGGALAEAQIADAKPLKGNRRRHRYTGFVSSRLTIRIRKRSSSTTMKCSLSSVNSWNRLLVKRAHERALSAET